MKIRDLNHDWNFLVSSENRCLTRQLDVEEERFDLPYDLRILLERDPQSPGRQSEGYYPGAFGMYQREFELTQQEAGEVVLLCFDGAYRDFEVRAGQPSAGLFASRRRGYSPFLVDLTGKIYAGSNTLNVSVNCDMLPASKWYTGAEFYRNVVLLIGAKPCIFPRWIRTRAVSTQGNAADVEVKSECIGDMVPVQHTILDAEGECVAQGGDGVLHIRNAKLWNASHPYLCTLRSEIRNSDGTMDEWVTLNRNPYD